MATEEEVKDQVVDRLASLLPQVEVLELDIEGRFQDARFDLVARVRVGEVERTLLIEVKSSGQPRYLRQVIARFRETNFSDANVHLLIAAPYISPRGMDICRRHQVGGISSSIWICTSIRRADGSNRSSCPRRRSVSEGQRMATGELRQGGEVAGLSMSVAPDEPPPPARTARPVGAQGPRVRRRLRPPAITTRDCLHREGDGRVAAQVRH